jgi:hypothetical protein
MNKSVLNWTQACQLHFNPMEQRAFKNVNNCLNTDINSYLDTSGGKSYKIYLNDVHFLTPVLIRHLWSLRQSFSCVGV